MKKAFTLCLFVFALLLSDRMVLAQNTISSLDLFTYTGNDLTNDSLYVFFSVDPDVVETNLTWYRNGSSLTTLQLPFEGDYTDALLDFSGHGNNAATGAAGTEPVWSATGGHNGAGAFVFDGNDDYLIINDALPLNSSYTKTAWIYINDTASDYMNIMSSTLQGDNNHAFKINPDGTLNAGHSFGTEMVEYHDSLLHEQWYFVGVSFDYSTGEMVLYVDGYDVARDTVPAQYRSVIDPDVLIGAKDYSYYFDGRIDDARIYNYAVSPEQMHAIYEVGSRLITAADTKGSDSWYVDVTPFTVSDVGLTYTSNTVSLGVPPAISGLTLAASSPDNLPTDDLIVSYDDTNESLVATATAWYRNGAPDALLHLPFEGGHDNYLLDFSGSGNHATYDWDLYTRPTYDPFGGHDGGSAFYFDSWNYLIVNNVLPLSAPYTKTAWIKLDSDGYGYRNFMSSTTYGPRNHTFKVDEDGQLSAGHYYGDGIVVDPTALVANQWYFVAVTFDYATGEMILYKNGSPVATDIVPDSLRDVEDPNVMIGAMTYSYNFWGDIDDPMIFGRVLSPEQIMSMYTTGNDVMMSEETNSSETWRVDVTPFSCYEAGPTLSSNTISIGGLAVSDIPDQTITEGATFTPIDLDDYVTDPAYADSEITWTSFGSTELIVTIDPGTHVATIGIPTTDWFGSEAISFVATNPAVARDTAQATFTVQNVNDAPVLTDVGAQDTDEDTNLTGLAVVFTDADPGDTHTITVESDEANVTVENLSGQVSGSTYDLVPAGNWDGTANITVTVTDNGTGTLSDFETYVLTVNPINDAPVLTEVGDQGTPEGTTLSGVAVVFTDPDATDTHTITVESDEANVTVANLSGQISGSTYDLVPAAFWNGTAHITVTVTDNGTGTLSDSETYTLTVTGTNDSPVLTDVGDQSTVEDNNLTGISVVFTDPDPGDTHTITVVSDEANVTMANLSGQISGSTYDLVPAADWYGTAHITVTVTDNGSGSLSDSETYTLTVTPVNDAPVLTEVGDQSINESTSLLGLSVVYTDPDPLDAHSVSVISDNPNVVVANFSGSSYDLVPAADWYGTAQITVTVTDNGTGALSDTETYTLTVNNINDAPVLTLVGNQSTNEDVSLTGLTVTFTDADPTDAHTITVVSDNANVTVENLSGQISGSTYDLVPAAEWSGTANITVTVTDNGTGALSDTETYPLTVISVNDAPVIIPVGDQNTDEGVSIIGLSVDFTDADPGDSHTITVVSNNANVTVANLSGQTSGSTYDLVPAAFWSGTAQITVTVTDNGTGALTGTEIYTLTVNSFNDAPVITLVGNQVTDEDISLTGIAVVFTDADATDTHTITVVSDEANVTVMNLSGQISGSTYDLVPAADWNGTAQITVTVTDNGIGTLSDVEIYTLTVNPVNDAPVLTPIGDQITAEGATRAGLSVVFTDPDATDLHTITIVSNNANVTVANLSGHTSGSTYDLVPAPDWNGTAQITVTVTDDGSGPLSDSETYDLTVSGTNDAPVLTPVGNLSTDEDVSRTGIPVVFTDPDPADTHTITVVSNEANVTVMNLSGQTSGSTYDLVPAADWFGTAQITVTVTDNGAGALSDYESYTLTVNPVNDSPTDIQLTSQDIDERSAAGTMVGVLSASDVDPGETFTYSLVAGLMDDDNGDFYISQDTLRSNAEFDYETKNIYLIRIQVSDGEDVFSLPFAITINDVDETGVEEYTDQLSFKVYPVPAVNELTVELDNPDHSKLHLEIYNSIGSVVHSEYTFSTTTIDISDYRSGMYVIVIKGENNEFGTRKIIVED